VEGIGGDGWDAVGRQKMAADGVEMGLGLNMRFVQNLKVEWTNRGETRRQPYGGKIPLGSCIELQFW
jgi:hypothetical protein